MHNWFFPHKDTHKKARLISWEGLLIYILLFLVLHLSFSIFSHINPGVLGTKSSIDVKKVIELTNIERAKLGLPPVSENSSLDQAAAAKADNMFAENYWAHYSPSGKDPWGFILSAGYRFSVAGENLAKSYSTSDSVVAAWMASPSHRENIVNPKYKDIGIAVVDGTLQGQETTLVVQMFGSTSGLASLAPASNTESVPTVTTAPSSTVVVIAQDVKSKVITVPNVEYQEEPSPNIPIVLANTSRMGQALFDPLVVYKTAGLGIIGLLIMLLIIDFVLLRKRGVFRITSHHLAHMSILTIAAATIISSSSGKISDTGLQFVAPEVRTYETTH